MCPTFCLSIRQCTFAQLSEQTPDIVVFCPRICQSTLKDEDFFFFLKHRSHNMIPCRQLSSDSLVSSDSQAGSTSLQFSREHLPEVGLLESGSRKGCCAM